MTYLGNGTTTGEALAWDGTAWATKRFIITPWVSYTPVFTAQGGGASIGNGTLEGMWRRIGDSMEVAVRMVWGSTTTAGSSESRWSIPDGYTIDDSKLASTTRGIAFAGPASASNRLSGTPILRFADVGEELATNFRGASTTNPTQPFTWVSGNSHDIYVDFPVLEWSS